MMTPVSIYRLCTCIRRPEPDSSLNKKGHEEECRMTYECGSMAYLDIKIGNRAARHRESSFDVC